MWSKRRTDLDRESPLLISFSAMFGRLYSTSCSTSCNSKVFWANFHTAAPWTSLRRAAVRIRKAGLTTGKLLELCTEHCMTPNLQRNKTEILFSLRGHESRQYKKDLYGPTATRQFPVVNEYGTFQVPVTSQYCHLGGLLHHAADQQAEIRRRMAIAHTAVTQHRKPIFRNWKLPLKKRVQLLEPLVLSKLLYGAETWVATDDKTEKFFHAAVLRLYRRRLPAAPDQHLSDAARARIPRQFGRHRVLSTSLRAGDDEETFSFSLTLCRLLRTDYVLHVVSVDIVIDPIWGDVMDKKTRQYWLDLAHKNVIAGFVAGPPCETWSRARGRKIAHQEHQDWFLPRVIRTACHLSSADCQAYHCVSWNRSSLEIACWRSPCTWHAAWSSQEGLG